MIIEVPGENRWAIDTVEINKILLKQVGWKKENIIDVIEDGITYNCATLGVNVKDTVKIVDATGFSISTPERNKLYNIQTPQVMNRKILLDGHKNYREYTFTDDTAIMEKMYVKTKITQGDYSNIKVTTKEDLIYLKDLI